MDELLPVGSVVSIGNNGEIQLMILGYYPWDDMRKQVYQYISVPWPMGITVPGNTFFLNNDQIHEVLFRTHETEESSIICKTLPAVLGALMDEDFLQKPKTSSEV